MTERDEALQDYIRGLGRKNDLQAWFSGSEPYTDEERAIAGRFGGKRAKAMARLAISTKRKNDALTALSGQGDLSENEQRLVESFNNEAFGRAAVEIVRKGRLSSYLAGNPEEDLGK